MYTLKRYLNLFDHLILSIQISLPLLCRYEPIGYPVSVHLYFYDERFQGYLVRQEVQNVVSRVRETVEVWAVPQATMQLENNLREFERLKNLEVGGT